MRERSIRRVALVVVVGLCMSGLVAGPAAAATFDRVSGPDRFATAAAISRDAFTAGVAAAYVVTGLDFPDALAAAPAAAAEGAPLLLVTGSEIPAATAQELSRLEPKKIVVVGNAASVGDQVLTALDEYTTGPVVRRHGADRFGTAAAVATQSFQAGVGVAFITNGLNFPDGLGGGAAAGELGGPVMFVEPGSIPGSTAQALSSLRPASIVILGGLAAVSSAVESQLARYSSSVARYAGRNRFTTSAAVAATVFPREVETVYLATGGAFPDALAGGAAAAASGAPLLLTNRDCVPTSVDVQIDRLNPARVVVLGGTSAVSEAVLNRTVCQEPPTLLERDLHPSSWEYCAWGRRYEIGSGRISGQSFSHMVSCPLSTTASPFLEYDLGRDYGALEVVVGQRDDSSVTTETVEFRVVVDGLVVATHESGFGQLHRLRIGVPNALRLRLEMKRLTNPGSDYPYPQPAWAELRLLP